LYGGARIGGDWSSDLTKPKKLAINGGLQFQTTFTYVNAGGLTTATRLAPELARGYSIIGVRNTGGNSSYQLPFYQDGTYNDADWNNFEAGHIVIIFNTDDATSCQVRGLVQNVQTAPNNGYTEIPGGVCWMLFYQGGRVSAINGSRSNHWVVISAFDNNF
jgi:hypothetical protein